MKINVNQKTTITLTENGVRIYNKNFADLDMEPLNDLSPGDTLTEGLWSIMNIFGGALYNGFSIPFETEIIIQDFTDLKPGLPGHFRLVLIRNSAGWTIVHDAHWFAVLRHCDGILHPGGCDYAEYRVEGLVYRLIRVEDAAEYDITDIKPEWALNPEDIA